MTPAAQDFTIAEVSRKIEEALFIAGVNPKLFRETATTPYRVAKMWVKEFFVNVNEPRFSDFALSSNPDENGSIIHFRNIRFVSCCAHHLLPFSGVAHLLYIPNQMLCGASKPSRLINHYAKKPQLQETLCTEVINRFEEVVRPKGSMLVMYAHHECMGCRGVHQHQSSMGVSAIRGVFRQEPELEIKGLELIKISNGLL